MKIKAFNYLKIGKTECDPIKIKALKVLIDWQDRVQSNENQSIESTYRLARQVAIQ